MDSPALRRGKNRARILSAATRNIAKAGYSHIARGASCPEPE